MLSIGARRADEVSDRVTRTCTTPRAPRNVSVELRISITAPAQYRSPSFAAESGAVVVPTVTVAPRQLSPTCARRYGQFHVRDTTLKRMTVSDAVAMGACAMLSADAPQARLNTMKNRLMAAAVGLRRWYPGAVMRHMRLVAGLPAP